MTTAIYQLRELVTEQDFRRRMQAFSDWEQRWVKTLYVEAHVDRLTTAPERAKADVHKHVEERAMRQLADELAKVAVRHEGPCGLYSDRIVYSVVVLIGRVPSSPEGEKPE